MVLLVSALAGPVAADERAVMLIVGDSLSAGYGIRIEESWPALLGLRLESKGYPYRVVNASISGDTTAGGARRLPPLLNELQPRVVVVALGANDGLRGIQPAEVTRNLGHMLDAIAGIGATAVLLKVRMPPNYGPQYASGFEQVFEDVASGREVVLAPFMLERFAISRSAFQSDGLHPVAAVQPQIVDTLWPSLTDAMSRAGTPVSTQ